MRYLIRLLLPLLVLVQAARAADAPHHVTELAFEGLRFTDPDWLKSYLLLNCPCDLSDGDIRELQAKLLTTQVFQSVDVTLQTLKDGSKKLTLGVKEKWTVIPVVRGAYGGGTPLLVAGIYDSHFLGRLYTFGAESRTYGNSPPGGVVWFRAPRWKDGFHYLNFELWRDNRIRSLYDARDEEIATIYGSALAFNAEALVPVTKSSPKIQAGLRYQYRDQQILSWNAAPEPGPSPPAFGTEKESTQTVLGRLLYDEVRVSQLNLDGLRVLLSGGPVFSAKKTRPLWEEEIFYYKLWPDDWNLVFHQYLSLTSAESYQSLTFLGGFDSIRGIPDGALVGNKAVYGNLELRKLLWKSPYAWVQGATYLDHGSAAMRSQDLGGNDGRTSFGMGLRLAIPQVHRLMFRFDYAWSLDRSGVSSVSAGLNQFIDPYRPL